MKTYSIWSLDVWGNSEDGYQVNDRSKIETVDLDLDEKSDEVILSEFSRHFKSLKGLEIDWVDEDEFYIQSKTDGYPANFEIKDV